MKLKLSDWLLAFLFWLVLFLACSGCSAQKWDKAQFRPAPETGEKMAIAGLLVKAVAAMSLVSKDDNVNKTIGAIGSSMIVAGVTININSGKDRKVKRMRFKH